MKLYIRRFDNNDMAAVVELSLLAWEPVFDVWKQILGPTLYPIAIYPNWRKSQRAKVEERCSDKNSVTWVAEVSGNVAGFVAYGVCGERGVIQMVAVHPEYQKHGIGTELTRFALEKMKEAGAKLVEVGTGGDDGHAPARKTYEKAGFTALPLVKYYKEL